MSLRHYQGLYLRRRLMELLYVGLLCFIANHFSPLSARLWPAPGLAFALLFSRGRHLSLGVALGTGLYCLWQSPSLTLPYTALRSLEAWLLVYLSYRYIGPFCPLHYRDSLCKFFALAAGVSLLSTALLCQLLPLAPGSAFCAHYLGLIVFGPTFSLIHYYVPSAAAGARLQRWLPWLVMLASVPLFYSPLPLQIVVLLATFTLFFFLPSFSQALLLMLFSIYVSVFMKESEAASGILIGVVVLGSYEIARRKEKESKAGLQGKMDNGISL